MILYFLRHGIAVEPEEWQGSDDDRPLTKEGIAKMKDAARAIADLALRIDVVVSSPLQRACTTATLVSRKLKGAKQPLLDDRLAAMGGVTDSATTSPERRTWTRCARSPPNTPTPKVCCWSATSPTSATSSDASSGAPASS